MSGQNYIGSKISLISLSDIRYVGVLHNINSAESTVALQNVQSFGTEGRKSNITEEIGPSDNIFDYVVFRGSDIKDLQVFEAPPSYKPEPVIQQNMSTPIPSANNYYYNQQHYAPYAPYGNYWQNTPIQPSLVDYQNSLDTSSSSTYLQEEKTVVPSLSPPAPPIAPITPIPVLSTEPIVIVENKLINTEKQEVSVIEQDENSIVDSLVKQVSDLDIKTTNVNDKVLRKEKQKSLDSNNTTLKASRSATRSTSTRRPSTTIRNSSSTTTRSSTISTSTTATSTTRNQPAVAAASTRSKQPATSARNNQPSSSSTRKSSSSNTRVSPVSTRDNTRNQFNSNHETRNQTKPIRDTSTRNQSNSTRPASASATTTATTTTTRNSRHRSHRPPRNGVHRSSSDFDFVSANAKFDKTELVATVDNSQLDGTLVDPDHFYNKEKSFFDDISCESKETNKGRGKYQEERKLNLETFGQTTEVQKRQRHRGRGGKGRNQREKKILTTTTTEEVVPDIPNEIEPSLLTELK